MTFRLLLHDRADGRWNMAVDHALFAGVGRPGAPPVIRLYGFAPPALSLGAFQRASEVLDAGAASRDGLLVVRRPTGGQAVLHDGELTYSVSLGKGHLRPFSKREVYRFVARNLLAALEGIGVRLLLAGERKGDPHNPDCFRTTGEYELADAAGRKLVGSAQMLSRAGALQHGAIPLDDSNRGIRRYLRGSSVQAGHESTSVGELLGTNPGFTWLRERLAQELARALEVRRDDLEEAERLEARRLLGERYGRDEWNLAP